MRKRRAVRDQRSNETAPETGTSMEMQVALSVFLERIPEFRLGDSAPVTWCGGQVRGPRSIPLLFTTN